jgi:beta-lactamase class A
MIPDFKKRRALCALSLLYLLSLPAYAQEAPSARNPSQLSRLQSRLQELSDAFPGVMGVAVRDLKTGEEISINGDRLFPMASVYKVPIMVEVFRQIEAKKFSLDDRIELGDEHRTLGSGALTLLSNGLKPTVKDLITLMIVLSDNEATDILLKKVGAENVTDLPESAGMAHKTGTIGSTTNDAGIMFVRGNPIAIAVFTVDKRISRGEVEERMGRLTRVVYDFFDAIK